MSIISMLFLFLFLPLSLAIYYLANDKVKEYVLLGISLFFYSIGSIEYIVLFVVTLIITVFIGRMIYCLQNKYVKLFLLIGGVFVNGGLLIFYKYIDCVIAIWGEIYVNGGSIKKIILPLGISFFTFKAISYLVDTFMGKAVLKGKPVQDVLYLSFFAQIQSGPLVRYNDMKVKSVFDAQLFSDGVFRFLAGFNKKVLIADVLANITTEVFAAPFDRFSMLYAWVGAVCYSLQLFFDFAGYSDMAIGISEMFGYQCRENFNYPYMTDSVTKFWRRWHISLGEWFRDYIYIPLGGNRGNRKWEVYINLFLVWVLTGLWHGAEWKFVAWGLGYFFAIAFERLTNLPNKFKTITGKIIYRVLTLAFINFQWVLFNSVDFVTGLRYIKKMLICPSNKLADFRSAFLLKEYAFFIITAIVLCFPLVPWTGKRLENKKTAYIVYEMAISLIVFVSFIWAISFVVSGQNNPFAYINF